MVKKILVPTDGSEHAVKAIRFAADLAAQYDATIYLMHVVSKLDIPEDFLRYAEVEGFEEAPEVVYLQKVGNAIIGEAAKGIDRERIKNVHTELIHGNPAEKILEFAKEKGIDMIVIGSRGLGGVKGLLLGSVSTKVCHLAECTCVTVK
jgi:nucleotide-binding universal stress UspA family protein